MTVPVISLRVGQLVSHRGRVRGIQVGARSFEAKVSYGVIGGVKDCEKISYKSSSGIVFIYGGGACDPCFEAP